VVDQARPNTEARDRRSVERRLAALERRPAQADLPKGRVAWERRTADQGPFTALTDMTGLSVTFDVVTGRTYRTTARLLFSSTVAADQVAAAIWAPLPIQLQLGAVACPTAGSAFHLDLSLVFVSAYTGSATHYVRAARLAGTGNITMVASEFNPAFILVEDLGLPQ
jgi:hypothetical protein